MQPLNYFLNPRQLAEVRRDQYFGTTPSPGGTWDISSKDYRGNQQSFPQAENQVLVQVVADGGGNITDSNNYYLVHRVDQWFGVSGGDIVCEMRLDSQDDLDVGDEALCIFSGVTNNSPDEDDDGFILVKQIIAVPVDHFFAKITSLGYACGSATPNAFAYTEQVAGTCGSFSDGVRTGTLGTQPTITVLSVGDGISVSAAWRVAFSTPPTNGTFTLTLSGTPQTFVFNVTHAAIDAAFGTTTTTGDTTAGFTITYTGDFAGHTLVWGGSSALTPAPQNPAFEINSNSTFTIPCYVMMFNGNGGKGGLIFKKTQTGDGVTLSTIFTLQTNSHVTGGTFTVKLDGGSTSLPLQYNCSGSSLQAAVTGCVVTGTSMAAGFTITMTGLLDHSLTAIATFTDDKSYEFFAPAPILTTVNVVTGITCVDGDFVLTTTPIKVAS